MKKKAKSEAQCIEAPAQGMHLSSKEARPRWREMLTWVVADLAPCNPEWGAVSVPQTWKPKNKAERVEEGYMRRLVSAQTAKAIGSACCPAFYIKELETTRVHGDMAAVAYHKSAGEIEVEAEYLDEAFRCLALSFSLADGEAHQARRMADLLDRSNRRQPMLQMDTARQWGQRNSGKQPPCLNHFS